MLAQSVDQPFAAGFGIGQGFYRGKGFGCDDKKCRFGIYFVQNFGAGRAVNVGDKVGVNILCLVFLQGLDRHFGTEIRTADTDVDNIGQFFAGMAFELAKTDSFGKFAHFGQDFVDFNHNVFAVDINRRVGAVSQGRVQNGAVLGDVDALAAEHGFDFVFKASGFGQIYKISHGFFGNAVFGIVKQQ